MDRVENAPSTMMRSLFPLLALLIMATDSLRMAPHRLQMCSVNDANNLCSLYGKTDLGQLLTVNLMCKIVDENKQLVDNDILPFNVGVVSYVVNGGGMLDCIHQLGMEIQENDVGNRISGETMAVEYNPDLCGEFPLENCPPGLKLGDKVSLSNRMKARVTKVTLLVY